MSTLTIILTVVYFVSVLGFLICIIKDKWYSNKFYKEPSSIGLNLDDCYLNGKGFYSETVDLESLKSRYKHVYIIGSRGIGKGVLGKELSFFNPDILYIEQQRLEQIKIKDRKMAIDIIEIKSIKELNHEK